MWPLAVAPPCDTAAGVCPASTTKDEIGTVNVLVLVSLIESVWRIAYVIGRVCPGGKLCCCWEHGTRVGLVLSSMSTCMHAPMHLLAAKGAPVPQSFCFDSIHIIAWTGE